MAIRFAPLFYLLVAVPLAGQVPPPVLAKGAAPSAVPAPAAKRAPSPAPVVAPVQSLAGSWAMRIDGAAIFRFDIEKVGDSWRSTWWKPRSFASDGNSFSRLTGPPTQVASGAGSAVGEWAQLTFPDPRPGAVPDVFRFRLIGPDRAEMIYVDTGLAPFVLSRVATSTAIGPWEANRVYRRVSVESLGLPSGVPKVGVPAKAPPGGTLWSLPSGGKPVEGR